MKKIMKNKKEKEIKNSVEAEKLRLDYVFESGVDFKNRIVRVSGVITGSSFEETFCSFDIIDGALTEMEKESNEPITLKVNSPGGEVYEGLAIVGRIKNSPCTIITEGYGHVMSASTLILACGDIRRMSRYCTFMCHQSSYGVAGSHEQVKEQVEQMERSEKSWAKWMAEVSSKSEAFWYKTVKKKDVYLSAEEVLKYGVIDEII